MNQLNNYKFTVLGVIIGAIGGYLYFHYIGCASGSCIITSKPINSTLYGALLGGLLSTSFKKNKVNKDTP